MSEHDKATQLGIIEEVTEEWQDLIEEGEEDGQASFAEQLKAWYDTQMQELHDSAGDLDYQRGTVSGLREFRDMIQQIKAYDFGMEDMEAQIDKETSGDL